jgi:predicted nucleic acid-binding protein
VAFTAFLDADVLFPVGLRDTLLWIAALDVYSPRWSADVLEEMRRNVLEEYPDITPKDMDEMIKQMRRAFPEAEVTGYKSLISAMPCNEKDRHVLAAAVIAKAGVLVTNNVKDFPKDECAELGIEVQSADDFLSHALSLDAATVRQALTRQAAGKKNPPMTLSDVLSRLEWTASAFVAEARTTWGIAIQKDKKT